MIRMIKYLTNVKLALKSLNIIFYETNFNIKIGY